MKKLIAFSLILSMVFCLPIKAEENEEKYESWYLEALVDGTNEYRAAAPIELPTPFQFAAIRLSDPYDSFAGSDLSSYVLQLDALAVRHAVDNGKLSIENVYDLNDPLQHKLYKAVYSQNPSFAVIPGIVLPQDDWQFNAEYVGVALLQGGKVRDLSPDAVSAVFEAGKVSVAFGEACADYEIERDERGYWGFEVSGDESGLLSQILKDYHSITVFPTILEGTIAAIAADENNTAGFIVYLTRRDESFADPVKKTVAQDTVPAERAYIGFSDLDFESGNLNPVEYILPEVTADDLLFDFPDELWQLFGMEKPEDTLSLAEAALLEGQPILFSLSPTGKSGIAGELAYYNGKFRLIYPAYDKSVEDAYQNFAYWFNQQNLQRIGSEGVVYSPDGRYAVMPNYSQVVINGNLRCDPILIDLSTGEAILTAAYANKFREENIGAMVSACFSQDSGTLYYVLLRGGSVFSLMSFDIAHLETKELMRTPDGFINTVYGMGLYYPRLYRDQSGRFLLLNDVYNSALSQGITEIRHEYGPVYSLTNHLFPLCISEIGTSSLLTYSEQTNRALLVYDSFFPAINLKGPLLFSVIDTANAIDGADTFWAISAKDYSLVKDDGSIVQESAMTLYESYMKILKAVLSPDGNYVLLYVNGMLNPRSTGALLLLRLEDMRVRKICDVEYGAIPLSSSQSSFKPVIEWNCDKLTVQTGDGIKTYVFE